MRQTISRVNTRAHTLRKSSWDRTGDNHDFLVLQPGSTVTLLNEDGPGQINHFYWTTINASRFHFRQLLIRIWWDGESTPSVEVPIGDLFCVPHCSPQPVQSYFMTVNPGHGEVNTWGLNMYFPMPFHRHARIDLVYEPLPGLSESPLNFWYHLDIEKFEDPLPDDTGYFHAQWRRERFTTAKPGTTAINITDYHGVNLDGMDNYVALKAEGCGHMVGLHLQVDNLGGGWYGEGDDMVFIDGQPGEQWPPTIPGTGTEEIFGGGACPTNAYSSPYCGFHMVENRNFFGKNAMYRWYINDPIRFNQSLTWTIEHGHDNNFENDYTSVAYWYQKEPHALFPALDPVEERLPRLTDAAMAGERERCEIERIFTQLQRDKVDSNVIGQMWSCFNPGSFALLRGDVETAMTQFAQARTHYMAYKESLR